MQGSSGMKLYDDFDQEFIFEYPRSWVGRSNSLRQGVYVSDFNVRFRAQLMSLSCSLIHLVSISSQEVIKAFC